MNKKRNTYFLHKVIVEEISLRITKKKNFEELKKIHERFFTPTSELGRELSILSEFYKSSVKTHEEAFRFLIEMKNQHKNLDKDKIFKEQTKLIKTLDRFSKEIFSNHLVEYRKICNLNNFLNSKLKVSDKIKIQNTLHESLLADQKTSVKKIEKIERIANKKLHESFFDKYDKTSENTRWIVKELLAVDSLSEMAILHQKIHTKCSKKIQEMIEVEDNQEVKAVLNEAFENVLENKKFTKDNLQKTISLYERCFEN